MIIRLFEENISEKHIDTIVKILNNDGICIIPTDTLYAFVCCIDSHKAAKRLAELKGKKLEKSNFSLLCNSLSMASDYIKPLTNNQFAFIKNLDTGKFTLILPASNLTPKIFLNKKKTIGIRISNNNIVKAITSRTDTPLLVTSVPRSDDGEESYKNAELLHDMYENKVDLVIESDNIANNPSTVIDMTQQDSYEIIRQGIGEIE